MPPLPFSFDQRLAWIIAAAIGIVVILAILRRLRLPERLPYQPVDSLLTPAERVFYTALLAAVGNAPISVLAKVRLADLVVIPKGTPEPQRRRGRVQAKHIDFILADRATLAPLLAIELDDSSHQRRDRIERDAFVDAVMRTIGLPILHVPCAAKYAVPELRAVVLAELPRREAVR